MNILLSFVFIAMYIDFKLHLAFCHGKRKFLNSTLWPFSAFLTKVIDRKADLKSFVFSY